METTSMTTLPDELLFDIRLVERHISKGLTTREAYEQYLEKLGDSQELGEHMKVEYPAAPTQE